MVKVRIVTSDFCFQRLFMSYVFLVFITYSLSFNPPICFFPSNGKEEKQKETTEEGKKEEKKPKDDSPRPRPLHRTCSLFMRSIAPSISKAEIIAVS